MRRRGFAPIAVIAVVVMALLWSLYQHYFGHSRLERCVEAQADHFYSTPEGKELHSHGTDPPRELFVLECNQLGIK